MHRKLILFALSFGSAFGQTLPVVQLPPISAGQGTLQTSNAGLFAIAPDKAVQGMLSQYGQGNYSPLATLNMYAFKNATSNYLQFSDGSGPYWAAGGSFLTQGVFADDLTLSVLADPNVDDFPAPALENIIGKFIAVANGGGEMPVAVLGNSTASVFYSSFDSNHAHASGDAMLMLPQLQYVTYSRTGSTIGLAAHYAGLKAGLAAIQVNSGNGLCQVVAGAQQWIPWLFEETALTTGDHTMCSMWLARDYQVMAIMAGAIGNTTDAATYAAKFATITASMGTSGTLWNSTTGMYRMGSGQNSANVDIDGSALACTFGFATSAQCTAISNYLVTNIAAIHPSANGYLKQTNGNFAFCGILNSGGTQTVQTTGFCASGLYQQALWTVQFGWVLKTIALTSPSTAATVLKAYLGNAQPAYEWTDTTGANVGSLFNLESTMGPSDAGHSLPAILPPTIITMQDSPINGLGLVSENSTYYGGAAFANDPTRGATRLALLSGAPGGAVLQTAPATTGTQSFSPAPLTVGDLTVSQNGATPTTYTLHAVGNEGGFTYNGLLYKDPSGGGFSPFWYSNGAAARVWAMAGGGFGWNSNTTNAEGSGTLDTGLIRGSAGVICVDMPQGGGSTGCGSGSLWAKGFQETLTTPSSSTATCTAGQFTDDANYHYVCTSTNNWKRAALSAF